MVGTLERRPVRNWRAWLLVGPTVRVTCWPSRRARGCSPTWHASATRRGPNELAAELGLHPSGVRVHLERLHSAGLIARERVPQPLGRPRDSWSIAPDALPGGQPPDAYRQLARWLAHSIPARPGRLREMERAGRELGRELPSTRGRARPRRRWAGRSPPWASLLSVSRRGGTSCLSARQLPLPGGGPREPARRLRSAPGADARPAGPARPGGAAGGLRSQGPGSGGMPDRGRGLRGGVKDRRRQAMTATFARRSVKSCR